jgi:uncharacterized protein YqeY
MLVDKIKDDLKIAMKARDQARVEVLRFLLAEVKNVGINERRELDDGVVSGVLQKLTKQRREGAEQFRAAGRDDLVKKEMAEMAILAEYMPRQLSDAELETRLRDLIAESGIQSKKDMGKLMKLAMEQLQGAADGKRVQAVAAKLLG